MLIEPSYYSFIGLAKCVLLPLFRLQQATQMVQQVITQVLPNDATTVEILKDEVDMLIADHRHVRRC